MTNYDRPSLRSVKASGPAVGLSAPLIIPIPSSCTEAALWPGRYLNHEGENLEAEGGTKRKKNRFAAEKKISHVSFDNLTLIYPPFFTPVSTTGDSNVYNHVLEVKHFYGANRYVPVDALYRK